MAKAEPKTPDVPAVPTQDYEVASRLEHDGATYMPGDIVALTDAQAALLVGGAVKAR